MTSGLFSIFVQTFTWGRTIVVCIISLCNLASEELVIKNLNGDEELFDYLKNCDLKTQRDVYNSLKEQYIQTQRDFNRLKATVSGV